MGKLLSTVTSWFSIVRKMSQSGLTDKENIRQFLSKFPGGKITMTKDNETGIAFIELNHIKKRNALSGKMMVDLRNCIEELEQWQEGKGVILYGAGKNFCSGGDLDFVKQIPGELAANAMGTWMADTLHSMQKLPIISLCLLTGPALGGGAEIATHCDYIVVADNVKCGFVHGKIGITTAWGGATALSEKLGRRKALDLLLTSKIMDAEECLDVGFADAVVKSENAMNEAVELLKTKLIHDVQLVKAFKEVCNCLEPIEREEMVKFEIMQLSKFWGGPLNRALLEKKIKHVK